ncbi:hypothetical protein MMC30_002015 [Trapelia coarctata]|nr:hypothetical protein [Trapelia coarctata]
MGLETAVHADLQHSLTYEETIEKALEESRKIRERHQRKMDERRTAEAIAMGFSSKEELRKHEDEERRQSREEALKRLAERAALEGKTLEKLQLELCAGQKSFFDGSPLPALSQCGCDNHPNPFFCPDTLVDYHSQELPEFMELSAEQHRLRVEELRLEPGDTSRRLAPKELERAWDLSGSPPLARMQLPPWARGNESIVGLLGPSQSAGLDHRDHGTPSLVSTSPESHSPSTQLVLTPTDSGMEKDHDTQQSHEVGINHAMKAPTHTKNAPMLRQRKAPRPSKKRSDEISRILKRSPNPARRTRSHKLIKFYELSQGGLPILSYEFPKLR